jgi:hypothetical protein
LSVRTRRRDEIVVGRGVGGSGQLELFEDELSGLAPAGSLVVGWLTYNIASGVTRPAAGDFDGDGRDEIVVGMGATSRGFMQIFDDATTGYAHMRTSHGLGLFRIDWPEYQASDGGTYPAAGDIDGDGRDEILVGLLKAGQGWVRHFDPTQLGDGTVDLPGIAGWLQEKSWALAISGAALAR